MNKIFYILTGMLLLQYALLGQTTVSPKYSVTRTVNAMIAKGDTLIVGGAFNYVGRYTGGGALVSATVDTPNAGFPKIIGSIFKSTPDGAGGFYIYGNYRRESEATTASSMRIEHILSDFTFESGFSLSVNALYGLNRMLYHNGILYIGGDNVSQIAGQSTGDFCGIDVSTKLLVSWLPTIDSGGNIKTIGIKNNTVYVGGIFTKIGGQRRDGIAAIQIGSGIIKPWVPRIVSPGYNDIEFYKNKIILGGGFSDGLSNNHACATIDTFSGDTVQYLYNSTTLYWAASVSRISLKGDTLFTFSGGTYDTRVTAIDLGAGNNILWKRYFNMIASASDIFAIDSSLYVGGYAFDQIYKIDSSSIVEKNIRGAVCLDVRKGTLKNWSPNPVGYINNDVQTLAHSGSNIFIGGKFSHINGLPRGAVFMLNTATQQVLPFQIQTNLFDECRSMKLIDSTLYIAGNFSKINDTSYNTSVAAFNINTGKQIRWYPVNLGNAFAIEANVNQVFLGGSLTEPSGGAGRTNLFAIDRQTGILNSWSPNPDRNVNSLHLANGNLYVGGEFNNISAQSRNKIAAYDTTGMSLTSWHPTVGTVKAIYSTDSIVWIGNSTTIFAGFDVNSGTLKKEPFSTSSFGGEVRSIIGKGRYIAAGGDFTIGTSPCKNVAIYDVLNDTVLPNSNFCMAFTVGGEYVNAMAVGKDDLYIGGDFTNVSSKMDATNIQRMRFPSGFFSGNNDSGTIAYYPKSGGNGGDVTINFWGNAIKPGMHVKLIKAGLPDIVVPDSSISYRKNSEMRAVVDLRGKIIGDYDLVITDSVLADVVSFHNGFTIDEYRQAKPWVNVVGNSLLRTGTKSTIIIQIGNDENCDLHSVSLLLTANQSDSVRFRSNLGFIGTTELDSTLFFQIDDTTVLERRKGCWLVIPKIGSSKNIILEYTPTKVHDIFISANVGNILQPGARKATDALSCFESVLSYAGNLASEKLGKAFPITGCAISVANTTMSMTSAFRDDDFTGIDALNLGGNLGGTFATCLAVAFPELAAAKLALDIASDFFTGLGIGTGMTSMINECGDINQNEDTYSGKSRASVDPNEKFGTGIGNRHFITGKNPLPYGIRFENMDTATLPAQVVKIIDTLDGLKLDLSTFQPNLITIGNRVINFTPGKFEVSHNENTEYIDLRPEMDIIVKAETKLDTTTGIFEALFTSLDPSTMMLTTNPLLGFLPPNTMPPSGEGAIYFSVRAKDGLPNLAEIRNTAHIYFDVNAPITTPTWVNTLDKRPPNSKVDSLPLFVNDTTFTVSWHGKDGESGIEKYNIYYSVNGGVFQPYITNIHDTSIKFTGKADTTYAFYSIAIDSVNNIEQKDTLEAITTIRIPSENQITKIYPNPNDGTFTVHINNSINVSDVALFDVFGKTTGFTYTHTKNDYHFSINKPTAHGVYILKIKTPEKTIITKIVVGQ